MKEISNIKISCVFELPKNWRILLEKIVNKRKIHLQKNANIIIIKDVYVFCIFERKDKFIHFNVTKIKSYNDIFNFIFFFSREYFTYETKLISLKIDNITASFNLQHVVDLNKVRNIIPESKFNPERFAGLFLKLQEGTVIIFRNGKVNIVGCKTTTAVEKIWNQINPILQKCVNM
jgi:Transcription factor TFIID (or TATA-binding protein, TBP)